jgi:hypothetical protein
MALDTVGTALGQCGDSMGTVRTAGDNVGDGVGIFRTLGHCEGSMGQWAWMESIGDGGDSVDIMEAL